MRNPAAIGFYSQNKNELEKSVKKFISSGKKINALGLIAPHAGFMFSGSVAGKTYASAVTGKNSIVIFGPNHAGYGSSIAASREDWITPLGTAKSNRELIDKIGIKTDESSHMQEHSIEVQLPFLQLLHKNFSFLPVLLQHIDMDGLKELADSFDGDNFYIASSDFIHYGPDYSYAPARGSINEQVKTVMEKDEELAEIICKLKAEKFYNTVKEKKYTVCGFVPITLLMLVMKNIGAKRGIVVDHKTSYDVQENDSFVDYMGIVFE